MKCKLIAAAIAAAMLSAPAWAQMGPGMMGGGYGMGPGMMGGYGMGPGMMGGYGPQGPGPRGGPGMQGGYGAYSGLNLNDEQRARIAEIQQDVSRKHWDLMGKVHEQRYRLYEYDSSGKLDENAARKAYQVMTDAHKAMFETNLDARKRIEAVLTKEQLEQLRRNWRGG